VPRESLDAPENLPKEGRCQTTFSQQEDEVPLGNPGPTIGVLEVLERDLGKPVISSNQACLWRALRLAGALEGIPGFGRLLRDL